MTLTNYLPRIGWEKFECYLDGELIDPSNTEHLDRAMVFRWAFVIGWGQAVFWAVVAPKEEMERFR